MKKLLVLMIAVLMIFSTSITYAADLGVQIIGGQEAELTPVSLDDIQLEQDIEIDNYAIIRPSSFVFADHVFQYRTDYGDRFNVFVSGAEADYALLKMDITNLITSTKDFTENCNVKVIFNDKYEYQGWIYQYDYNLGTAVYRLYVDGRDHSPDEYPDFVADPKECVVDPSVQFPIDPMYVGHYLFGCTLPNSVVNSKDPLRMVIELDGNEITYNIRK